MNKSPDNVTSIKECTGWSVMFLKTYDSESKENGKWYLSRLSKASGFLAQL